MDQPQWLPVDLDAASTHSSVSSRRSSVSAASFRTTGSLADVPPAMRRERNQLRVELDVLITRNDIASAEREATKHSGPKLPIFNLPYFLNKEQLSFLTARYPRTTFRCTQDTAHDHPIAHTETLIAVKNAQRMVPAGHTVVDLFGSPSGCDAFNRAQAGKHNPKRAIAYVALKTEKDYLRSLNWGETLTDDGTCRYIQGEDILHDLSPTYDSVDIPDVTDTTRLTYLANHTMYYLSDLEIATLLKPKGSRMLSVVHRHPNAQGTLFNGECTYGKKGNTVEQVNVLTGERYVHRDLSWLWDSSSKVIHTEGGSFVWTFHMVSPDTWIIQLTGCSPRLDERVVARTKHVGAHDARIEVNEHSVAPSSFPHPALLDLPAAKCTMVSGVPFVRFTDGLLPDFRLSCPGLYDFLRVTQVGKPRTSERLMDLFSLARSHIANGSEFPGKRNFVLPPEDIAGHVVLAFLSGLTAEVDLLRAVEGYRVFQREHSALLDGSAVVLTHQGKETAVQSAVSVLKRVNAGRKQGDLFSAALSIIE